ncbi:MAG: hypothetical protein WAK01_05370, partial [Methylocystis sp.]
MNGGRSLRRSVLGLEPDRALETPRPISLRQGVRMDARGAGEPEGKLGLLALGALGVVYGDIGTSP